MAEPPPWRSAPAALVRGITKSGYLVNLAGGIRGGPDSGGRSGLQRQRAARALGLLCRGSSGDGRQHSPAPFATDTRGTIYFNNTGVAVPAGMAGAAPLQ